jgi:putative ABC transport system permease protein
VALDRQTAVEAGVTAGGRVTVVAAGRRAAYRVSGVLDTPDRGIFFTDATARRLSGQSGVDLIALRADASARAAAGDLARTSGLTVSAGAARGDVEAPDAAAARGTLPLLASSLAGVTLLVIGFIVAGALAVSIGAQRRDLALMRAVGATPRQVRRLAAAQATLVAAAALVPGIPLGYLMADRFREVLVFAGLLPDSLPLTFSPIPAVAAALLLVGVVRISAWGASFRTSRMAATEAVAESQSEPRTPSRRRAFAGLLLIVGAIVLSVAPLLVRTQAGAAVTAFAGILATIGLALAGPALIAGVSAALARRLPRRVSAPTWLAVANSRGYALRVAGAVTTLAMALVFTLTYALTQTTVLAATNGDVDTGTRAQFKLIAPALGVLPADLAAAVRAVPGVRAAAPVTTTTVLWSQRMMGDTATDSYPALVLTPAASGVLDLGVRSGSLAGLTGDTVALDDEAAKGEQVSVGGTANVILGDGTQVSAKVVAIYSRGLGFGPVALSRDLAAGHTWLDQSLLIRTDGTDQAHRVLAAYAASHPGLALGDATAADGTARIPPELWINIAVLGVLLGYLLLGIANKLVASTVQRRHEIAALQLIGATPRQIRAMMRREATLIAGLALSTGLLLSAVPLALLALGFLHRPWPAGPIWLAPAAVLVIVALAYLTTELPTRRVLRVPPAEALTRA